MRNKRATRHFTRVKTEPIYQGQVVDLSIDTFRHDDGSEVTREVISHPGAIAVIAHDGTDIYLVRQPREATGESLLEVPAGKLDPVRDGGERPDPLQTAKRELAEEIGKAAQTWEHLCSCYTSPGFADEFVHIYLATGLSDQHAEAEEEERIEIVKWPISELDSLIARSNDAKTLVAALQLRFKLGG